MKPDLRNLLKKEIITGDGAMGTYLYHLGFPVGISYEELNVTKPDVIAKVHSQYYDAGARLIETNTFSANREKLAKFGLENEVRDINRKGVEIARSAVGSDAYIAAAIGSIRAGKRKNLRTAQLKNDYQQQIASLLEAGPDAWMLETFFDMEECLLAVRLIREVSDLPLICQFASEDIGRTMDGIALDQAFRRLRDEGADVTGFNCRTGPNGILRAMEKIRMPEGARLSVFPNAGIPDYVDGRYTYISTPEYFADCARKFADLGARIIGGCCGTTPEHIQAVNRALRDYVPQKGGAAKPALSTGESLSASGQRADASGRTEHTEPNIAAKPIEPQTGSHSSGAFPLANNLVETVKSRHTVIVELDPPRGLDISKFLKGCEALKQVHADAITMADNSLAVTRMSNMALGSVMKEKLGVNPLVHIACRDRNLIGTQSHLMGLHALGIRHVLAVTGDPARFGDLPGSSSVYDLTSFEIIRMIKQLNEGVAFSGKPLKQKASFVVGAAFNPNVRNYEKALQRLERKVEAGADFIMTQPVYSPKLIERMAEDTRNLGIPVFIGIMPLASGRNAEYLHNEVPGIQLSDEVRERMSGLEGEEGRLAGIEIAKELLNTAAANFKGIYLITPFMLYDMTAALTSHVWQRTNPHLYPLLK